MRDDAKRRRREKYAVANQLGEGDAEYESPARITSALRDAPSATANRLMRGASIKRQRCVTLSLSDMQPIPDIASRCRCPSLQSAMGGVALYGATAWSALGPHIAGRVSTTPTPQDKRTRDDMLLGRFSASVGDSKRPDAKSGEAQRAYTYAVRDEA